MMWKKIMIMAAVAGVSATMGMTAYAAGWQQNTQGKWYATDDAGTSWYSDGGFWIDDDGDNYAEKYYFDADGYLLTDTTTPDGNTVNQDGAWVIDGFVQRTSSVNYDSIQNVDFIAGGYNEDGISLVALDMMNSTKAENAQKYGVLHEFERMGYYFVTYNNGYTMQYFFGTEEVDIISAQKASAFLKGVDDSINDKDQFMRQAKALNYDAALYGGFPTILFPGYPVSGTNYSGYAFSWYADNSVRMGRTTSYR